MSLEGPYILVSKLGEGGMAEVFKAVKTGPDGFEKPIALKRILPFLADQPEFISMLSAEARLHAYLDHPNIVQIIDFFREGDTYMIALEYVPGRNLRQITITAEKKEMPMPWPAALHIMGEVLKGLDFAHKREGPNGPLGIVHRDVSPQNILISYDGLVKLSDFGIAWANIQREKTESGVLKGKHRYLAPEQLSGKKLDRRADLFSAAIVLYELLCSRHPFDMGSDFETMKKIEQVNFVPTREIRPDLPNGIHDTMAKALAINLTDRYQDASELRQTLMSAQDPLWLTRGTEELREWLRQVYPKLEERMDKAVEGTPLLSKQGTPIPTVVLPIQSLISGIANISLGGAKRPESHQWTLPALLILAALIVGGATAWIWKARTASTPTEIPIVQPSISNSIPSEIPASVESTEKKGTKKAPAAGFSTFRFEGPKGAKVYLNGNMIGTLPLSNRRIPSGFYVVLLAMPGGASTSARIKIKPGETRIIRWGKPRAAAQ